ncbi:hypothetical protein SK128_022946 [Halocaridina rubra]|uniref:MADF domain-containing protein n=1 Tax=Halocaridina rubra TaxID=373956 RepID=A0AAN8WU51_HALRR
MSEIDERNTNIFAKTGIVEYYPKSSSQESVWQRNQIYFLIKNVEKFYEDFHNSSKKKKTVWQAIAKEMAKEGYQCTGADCDKKWRNLKATYIKVRRKQSQAKSHIVHGKFEYFEAMHDIMEKDINPSETRRIRSTQCTEALPEQREIIVSSDYQEPEVNFQSFVWSPAATNVLLNYMSLCLSIVPDITNIQEKWTDITERLNNEGFQVTKEDCQQRWENLQNSYHKRTSHTSGEVSDQAYFSQIQNLMTLMKIPTSVKINVTVNKKPSVREVVSNESEGRKLPIKRVTYTDGNIQADTASSLLNRVRGLDSAFSIRRRLDSLEERVNERICRQDIYKQTNNVLAQIVSELKSINRMVEAGNKRDNIQQFHQPQGVSSPSPGIIIVKDLSAQL